MTETLRGWLADLRATDAIIVVDGPKNRAALLGLGARRIVTLSRKPIYTIAEEIAAESGDAVILTDFDRKGKELYGKLSVALRRAGVHIEGITTFMRNAGMKRAEGDDA